MAAFWLLHFTYEASTIFTNVEMYTAMTEGEQKMKEKVLNCSSFFVLLTSNTLSIMHKAKMCNRQQEIRSNLFTQLLRIHLDKTFFPLAFPVASKKS